MTDTAQVLLYRVDSSVALPRQMTEGAAGFDLVSAVDSPVVLRPFVPEMILTGIRIALPVGFEAQVRPRSSFSKKGLICPVGTVDADYRGEIAVILINCTGVMQTIAPGDRIAQLVVAKVPTIDWKEVGSIDELGKTERGESGFGSTGN